MQSVRPLFLLAPLLVLGPTADAQSSTSETRYSFTSVDPDATTPPTLISQGAPLHGAISWRLKVQANGAATFSGTGKLAAYHWQVSKLTGCTTGCYWRVPQFDCKLTSVVAGQKRVGCGDYEVRATPFNSASAIAYVPEDIGLSVSSTVSFEVEVVQQ